MICSLTTTAHVHKLKLARGTTTAETAQLISQAVTTIHIAGQELTLRKIAI